LKQQPVVKAIEILRILFEQNGATGMNVNEIFKKTGSKDKPLVIESIKYLEKANLVETDQAVKYTQKKMKILTNLGQTFVELIDSVDKYNNLYEKLKQAAKQNFDQPKDKDKNILANILVSRGWKIGEAAKYKKLYEKAQGLLAQLSPRNNIDALLTRYASLLSQRNVIENENTMAILNKIITDLLARQITVIQKDLEDNAISQYDDDENKDGQLSDYVATEKFAILDILFANTGYLENRFINKEAKEVLSSILNILKPSKKAIHYEYEYDAIGEIIDTYVKEQNNKNKGYPQAT
jgi:DNA-binding HxlR family transcriptional regulator